MINTRKDKIALLKAIQNGEINPKDLPSNPIIYSRVEESWVALSIAASQWKEEGCCNVIFIGTAEREWTKFMEELKARKDKDALLSNLNSILPIN